MSHDLDLLFRPRSVAIIGASDKNPWTRIAARTLQDVGFAGPLHLVNRRGTPALGLETITSCAEAEGIDAAFIAVPAVALGDAIEDMAAAGVRYGAVVTSGFAETGGEGAAEQARLFDRARALGVTLLGPNSLGFTNFVDRVSVGAMPLKLPVLERPRVGLVSQSGATTVLIAQLAHQQNVALSHMVAMGNEAVIDLADVIRFLVEDEATKAIAVFAESIRRPDAFAAAARAAAEARKPIVMLKVGTGELTATVAQAHTGALVGDDKVFQAVCDAYNIVRVGSLEDLAITADMLAAIGPVDPARGFSLISISGGACEIVADRGEEVGIEFPPFGTETLAKLSGVIADFGAAHNPIDITGASMSRPAIYSGVMEAVGADPAIGLIGVIQEIPASEAAASPMSEAALSEVARGFGLAGVPGMVIQQVLKPITDHGRAVIARHGLPLVTGGMDHAVRAIGHLYQWSRRVAQTLPRPVPAALEVPPELVGEHATLAWLATRGVPVIPQKVARSRAEAVAAAAAIGGAVALKILSPDIQHKTEVGGVLLGLEGEAAVGDGFDRIIANVKRARSAAAIDGILVSPMRRAGTELIVGVARDEAWGLVLAVGLGGVLVELLQDTQLRVLPVSPAEARDMVGRLKGAKLLMGYRGAPAADLDRLAEAIAAIGEAALVLGDRLDALEINPLRVDGAEIEALDALLVWRHAG